MKGLSCKENMMSVHQGLEDVMVAEFGGDRRWLEVAMDPIAFLVKITEGNELYKSFYS